MPSKSLFRYIGSLLGGALEAEPPGTPADLRLIAQRFGAGKITYGASSSNGFTDWSTSSPTIQIAIDRSEGRRRAILAHECGHLLFDPIMEPASFLIASDDDRSRQQERVAKLLSVPIHTIARTLASVDIEVICDVVAVELMIPDKIVADLRTEVTDLQSLRRAGDRCRVSLAMLTNRLADAGGQFSLLRMVQTTKGAWICASWAGLPPSLRGRISCQDVPCSTRDGALSKLQMHFNGSPIEFDAQVQHGKSGVLVLAHNLRAASRPAQSRHRAPIRNESVSTMAPIREQ